MLTIKASDFDLPANVEILNPELEIASLTSDVNLNLEVTIENGIGYAYPDEGKREEIGTIPLDSILLNTATI